MAYTPTNPSVSQVFTEGYMSGEDLINRPDIYRNIFPFLKESDSLIDFLIASGRKKETVQTRFYWHEEDALIPMAKIKTVAGTSGAGEKLTVTIEALNTSKEIPFKKWDIIRVGTINGWIEKASDITVDSVNGEHSFVLTPVNNTKNIVAAATVGNWIVWVGTAKADGTAQPGSMVSKPLPFSGYTQIIATNYTTHGSAAANKAYVVTQSGKEYFYYRGVEQAVVRHKMAILYTLLVGQEAVGLADTGHEDGSQAVHLTSGLDERMTNNGNPLSNTAFDFDEWQNVVHAKLNEVYAPEEFFMLCGSKSKNSVDNILFDRNITNTSASYGAFATNDWTLPGDPRNRAVSYNFVSAKLGARTYHIREEKALSYPTITGAPGQPFPDAIFFLPADQLRDPKTGEWMDALAIRYKRSDREDRFTTEWVRDYHSDDVDKFRFNHRSELGLMAAKMRQTVIWKKS